MNSLSRLRAFALIWPVLGAATVWALKHGYVSDEALRRSALAELAIANPATKVAVALTSAGPVSTFLTAVLAALPGISMAAAPYVLSTIAGALLLARWHRNLLHSGWNPKMAAVCIGLLMAHPYLLFVVTSGSSNALALAAATALFSGAVWLVREPSARSALVFAAGVAAFAFTDGHAPGSLAGLAVLLPLVLPPRILKASVPGAVSLVALPVAASAFTFAYVRWVFLLPGTGDMGGARLAALEPSSYAYPWPVVFLLSVACGVATCPLFLAAFRWIPSAPWKAALFGAALPAAAWIATRMERLVHPAELSFLLLPLAALVASSVEPRYRKPALALLALGTVSAWALQSRAPLPDTREWTRALLGREASVQPGAPLAAEALKSVAGPVLLDDRSAYAAVAGHGPARNILIPGHPVFEVAAISGRIMADAVVVHSGDVLSRPMTEGLRSLTLAHESADWSIFTRPELERSVRVAVMANLPLASWFHLLGGWDPWIKSGAMLMIFCGSLAIWRQLHGLKQSMRLKACLRLVRSLQSLAAQTGSSAGPERKAQNVREALASAREEETG